MTMFLLAVALLVLADLLALRLELRRGRRLPPPPSHHDWAGTGTPSRPYRFG